MADYDIDDAVERTCDYMEGVVGRPLTSLERETIEDVIYLIAEKARAEDANAGD